MQTPGVAKHRLFFALWPSDELRAQVESSTRELVREVGGRTIPAANLHVTLAFLGSVPVSALDEVVTTAAGVQASAFTLTFNLVEIWARARVLVLTATETPSSLRTLVDSLQISSLQSKASAEHQDYRAHITLARDVHHRKAVNFRPPPSICWLARDFALVESRPGASGSIYSVLHRWELA